MNAIRLNTLRLNLIISFLIKFNLTNSLTIQTIFKEEYQVETKKKFSERQTTYLFVIKTNTKLRISFDLFIERFNGII
jgi:hypothetical protein